jgi:DNA-binding MarR family transcriptional regulator
MSKPFARALRHMPTVYFYAPAVRRDMGKDAGLRITEDICAVLWLTELATTNAAGAQQASVRRAAGLSQSRMSTVLSALVPRFLKSSYAQSRRSHLLRLTVHGSTLLANIKEERAKFLRDLFSHLTGEQQAACADALNTLEATMWQAIPR